MIQQAPAISSIDIVAPHVRDLAILEQSLGGWLAGQLPDAQDLRLTNFTYPRGAGMSHETILFDAHWNERGEEKTRGLVLRVKPREHCVYQDDMFVEQFRIMQLIHGSGIVPVAEVLYFEQDPTLLGAPFFVMEKMIGRVPVNYPPYSRHGWVVDLSSDQRHTLWHAAISALARLQHLPVAELAFLDPDNRFDEGFDQEWDRYRRFFAWVLEGRSFPFLERVWSLLEESRPNNRPPGLVWGDARIGNLMFADDCSVSAVMDFEQISLGGALHDLGWWLASVRIETIDQGLPLLEGMGTREETIALWQQVTGIEATDIEWYERFAAFKLACLTIRVLGMRGTDVPGMNVSDNPPTRLLAESFGLPMPQRGDLPHLPRHDDPASV